MRLIGCLLLGILSPLSLYPATISGNGSFPEHELLEYLATHDVHFTDLSRAEPDQLKRSRHLLEFFYQDRGYLLTEVKTGIKPFIFRIVEGPRVSSIRVYAEGNHEIGDKTLKQLLGDSTRISLIREGILRIRKAYRDRGFLEATLEGPSIEVIEGPDGWPLLLPAGKPRYCANLRLAIEEGSRFRYGHLQLPLPGHELPVEMPPKGEYYSEAELVDLRENLLEHFRKDGRFLSDLQIQLRVNRLTLSVDLEVSFQILPALSIRKIEFDGDSVFPDSFYRRELHLVESEPLDPRNLEQSLKALRRTGALTSIGRDDVEITVHADEEEADLLIHLHEKDRQRVQFSAGPGGLQDLELSVFYTISNLIGLQEKTGLRLQMGSNTSELALGTAFRQLVGSSLPVDLALSLVRRNTGLRLPTVDGHVRRFFFRKSQGLSGSARFRFSRNQSLSLDSGFEKILEPEAGLHWVLRPSWQLDEKTSRVARQVQVGQRFSVFEGTLESWNWGSDASWSVHFPVSGQPDDRPLSLRFKAAWTRFFGEGGPFSDRLFLNGGELRGFPPSSGPWGEVAGELIPIGGDTRFSLSSEYEHQLHSLVSLVPFADAGMLFSQSDPRLAHQVPSTNRIWRSSLGGEVRLHLSQRLPKPRLILAWNPLRLDRQVRAPGGLARLKDPAFVFRVRF